MTDQQIDRLIAARNSLTDVCLPEGVYADTAAIDALLSEVAPGMRNDVDRLLGRTCATLTPRVDYGLSAAELAVEALYISVDEMLETTRRIWRETEPIEY
jgi:hypothetical protein